MKQRMQKLAAGILTASMILGMGVNDNLFVRAEEGGSVGVAELSDDAVSPPSPWGALPSPNQYRYQKEELAAFCHFGPNTYSGYEWGFNQNSQTWLYEGQTPAELFPLSNDFDAETLVMALQEAGFKKLIVTAKHHDGFCIWNSKWTEYDVAESDYKNGKGDILAEISAACTAHDMDMGLYLSPWDVAEPSYGYFDEDGNSLCSWSGNGKGVPKNGMTWEEMEELDVRDYNEYYDNQLEEILSSPKYGNNGHFVEVWMDGAKGDSSKYQEYDFVRWFKTIQKYEGKEAGYDDDCLLFGAEAYTTVRWIGNELGLANEETWSKSQVDYDRNTIESNRSGANRSTIGIPEGNQWTVPEADARITSGWFWGTNKKTPKSMQDLSNMYFNSVGHNAVLLLNIPPNMEGTVDEDILNRVKEFGTNVKDSFAKNLAVDAKVTASEVRGNDIAFSPDHVIDGDDATYWTMEDDSTTGSLTLDLGKATKFDMVTIEEAIQLGQRIKSFTVEYKLGNGAWQDFSQGTTIGAKRICREKAVTADKIRINITDSYAVPLISEVGVYKATKDFEIQSPIPDEMEKILISDTDISDGSGFAFTGDWKNETGNQFIDGVGIWANSGAKATLTFTGHKVWLFGTKDPSHGTADVYIDGAKVGSFNTKAEARATGQMIYESDDLEPGTHTLEIRNTGTVGLNVAAVLNNEQKGVIQFEKQTLTMEEDAEEEVVVKRVGGSRGRVTVLYENNPGSAVQGNYDVDGLQGELVFEDGETEKIIKVATKRDPGVKGELDFTVDLISATGGASLGFYTSLGVIIKDLDDPERLGEADKILKESQKLDFDLYASEGREEVQKLTAQLNAYLKAGDMIAVEEVIKTANQLQAAKAKLTVRENYTTADPFAFPVHGAAKTVEAELFTLDGSGAVDSSKFVRITEKTGASNGKEVNWFENGNRILLPFTAEKAGMYKVKVAYRSGATEARPNALEWSGTNISTGSRDVYGNQDQYQTIEFEVEITEPGAGEWVFTASSKGGPVIDKFEITSTDEPADNVAVAEVALEPSVLTLTDSQKNALLSAVILPDNATNKNVTFTSADPKVAEVTEDGLVISRQNGSTVITVTTEDGSKTASCTVTVKRKDLAAAALETALLEAKKFLEAGQGNYSIETWNNFKSKYAAILAEKDSADTDRLTVLVNELKAAVTGLEEKAKVLGTPTGVTAVSKMTGVSIAFSSVTNAVSYDIYRKSGNGAAQKIASVKTASYLDENAPGGQKSDYTVVAVSGRKDYTDSAASAPASVTLPKAVTKLKVKAVSGGAQISFKKVKGAKKYIILRAAKKGGPYKKIKTLKAKQTKFVDKKAKKGKNYYKVVTQKGKTYSPATKAKKTTVKK